MKGFVWVVALNARSELADRFSPAWVRHLGLDELRWPRRVGVPKPGGEGRSPFWQKEVTNEQEYIDFIASKVNGRDLYTQLYSDEQRGRSQWDKVYIDLDVTDSHPTVQDIHPFMMEIVDQARGLWNRTPRVYFSGTKGYSIYFDFEPIQVKIETLRVWVQEQIIDRLGLPPGVIDTTVLGDKSRISRIPYTMNYNSLKYRVCENCLTEWNTASKKGGKIAGDMCPQCNVVGALRDPTRACIPVDPEWSVEKILAEAEQPTEFWPVMYESFSELAEELIALDLEVAEAAPVDSTYVADPGRQRQLLTHIWECAPKITDGRYRLLGFVIVPALVEVYGGESGAEAKITAWCHKFLAQCGLNASDYDHYISQTIRRTMKGPDGTRPWAPWSLETYILRFPEFAEFFLLDLPEGLSEDQMNSLENLEVLGFQILKDRVQGEVRSKKGDTIYPCGWTKKEGPWCTCEAGTRKLNCIHAGALLLRAVRQSDFLFVSFLMDKPGDAFNDS